MKKPNTLRTDRTPPSFRPRAQTLVLGVSLLCASVAGNLRAQAPCPGVTPFATGLLAPNKIIQTPRGNFIVTENGPEVPNNGRVSIVDQTGNRRTLLAGLPSARTFVGDYNGTTGAYLKGRTLYVLNGQGDVTLPGPVQGTERANPTPASPIFSSVLAVHFSATAEATTTGVSLTPADHQALKDGERLVRTDASGQKITIELVVDFPDYVPEPRPNFADNVRHAHPYGIVADEDFLYIIDAGFNKVRKLDLASGVEQALTSFAPTPNSGNGPPFIENVPTSIRWDGDQLLVTLLSGAPFIPGLSQVRQVHPETGATTSLLQGLTAAIDVTPLSHDGESAGFLTLEFNLNFPAPGLGRLQFFAAWGASPVILAGCLTTSTSMVWDRKSGRLVIAELATGRLVTFALP
ncbi:MAG: ScyD/ScyE family protein [Verrucomicrobia bacterium]|nr:ScyD/ScyE family protein [Verrucomicrobiota bacterium]